MCQINTDPMRSQMGYLEVTIPPDILNEDGGDDHVATEGGNVRVKCRATGMPEPRVSWKREDLKNIVLRQEGGVKEVKSFDGENLELMNIQRTDMGVYLCIASNGIPPSVSKRILVQVHFHPSVKVPNDLFGAPVGTDVSMQCNVETSPKALNSWFKETAKRKSLSHYYHSSRKNLIVKFLLSFFEFLFELWDSTIFPRVIQYLIISSCLRKS
ncbi:unnamed protein product [Nesidiocoris tenuis]|uniref:Ig-like domain-containing protein n=1 Tax=Nesidiocoris tenuis TaxID=355587 RepID=A0A6H5FU95_9HEMI|nr:unnamed protein product [Nesidiocoris tenuis]